MDRLSGTSESHPLFTAVETSLGRAIRNMNAKTGRGDILNDSLLMSIKSYSHKLRSFYRARFRELRARRDKKRLLTAISSEKEIFRSDWQSSLTEPNKFYERCFRYFHSSLPRELRQHRQYFSESVRGFGEDSFHVMWWLIFQELRPSSFLEIGVYRGQVISLISLLSKMSDHDCEVYGISPFSNVGDSVSSYSSNIDYYDDTLTNFRNFKLPMPHLVRSYSTDATARDLIESRAWDCIYIDGNHEYETAKSDWEICSSNIRSDGFIVLDDAALTTAYTPPAFASAGHPGPSRIAAEINKSDFLEILQVGHNRVFMRL